MSTLQSISKLVRKWKCDRLKNFFIFSWNSNPESAQPFSQLSKQTRATVHPNKVVNENMHQSQIEAVR